MNHRRIARAALSLGGLAVTLATAACELIAVSDKKPDAGAAAANACVTNDAEQSVVVGIDDGNPCTTDWCDSATGVHHTPMAAGTSCSDGNVCNGAETCAADGSCAAGTPLAVDDGDPSTIDTCDPAAGVQHTKVGDAGADADASQDAPSEADAGPDVSTDVGPDAPDDGGQDAIDDVIADVAPDVIQPLCLNDMSCALGLTPSLDSTMQGGAGGTDFPDDCPAGQVLVGFNAVTSGSFDGMQGVCGTPTLVPTGPDTFDITISPGATLPQRGAITTFPDSGMCPPDQMVYGFEGRAGSLIDELVLLCTPLSVIHVGNFLFPSPGLPTWTTPVSGTGGGGAFPTTFCNGNDIATGVNIQTGSSIDGFGLRCSTLTVQ